MTRGLRNNMIKRIISIHEFHVTLANKLKKTHENI